MSAPVSIRDLVEARIQRVDGTNNLSENFSGFLHSTAEVLRVPTLKSGVSNVEGMSKIISDSAHTNDSMGGAA